MLQTEAVKKFLELYTWPDLAALYTEDMEVQVLADQRDGSRVEKQLPDGKSFQVYTDGIVDWYSIRIPKNANSNPEYQPKQMTFNLIGYAEGIGCSGWDWKNKCSRYVAFDFDSLVGHSAKHQKKLDDIELTEITTKVQEVEWVTIRRSTSGKGLHLYIHLDPVIDTANHIEHSALARCLLGQLSARVNLDLQSRVDNTGGIFWLWHKKMGYNQITKEPIPFDPNNPPPGLKILKQGIPYSKVPSDWIEHVPVIKGQKHRSIPLAFQDLDNPNDTVDAFDLVCGRNIKIKLDDSHQKLIRWLESNGYHATWNADRWMLVTHTHSLLLAHQALNLVGPYQTNSPATELEKPNCWCIPGKNGSWTIRRYTPGVGEADTWFQDASGFTCCYYNRLPPLSVSAKMHGGQKSAKGHFVFRDPNDLAKSLSQVGINVEIPNYIKDRSCRARITPDGDLVVEIKSETGKDSPLEAEDWILEGKWWHRVFQAPSNETNDVYNFDDLIRHLISQDGKDLGFVVKNDSGWVEEPLANIKLLLAGHYNCSTKVVTRIIGSNINKPWTVVNQPFQAIYPGGRQWNRRSAQFRFTPSHSPDPLHPTWDLILNHIGQDINQAVKDHEWCRKYGITSGKDYLLYWIASLFTHPYQQLPYLFLWGPQNSGKSTLAESLSRLMTTGYCRADHALISSSGFNGELENAVLCSVEEINLSKSSPALERIKDWVTSLNIPIHKKQQTPIMIPNTTHFIQTANNREACPIFMNDTRVTMINVPEIISEIPRYELYTLLDKESPDFLTTILFKLSIPPPHGRLGLPVISTEDKRSLEKENRTELEVFIEEHCYPVLGSIVSFSDFYDRFKAFLDPQAILSWSKIKTTREIPSRFPKGKIQGSDQSLKIGNLSFDPNAQPTSRMILVSGFLKPETILTNNGEQK